MTFRVGDVAFMRDGSPSIVKGRDKDTAKLSVDRDLKSAQKDMRHGYINGLKPETREQLNRILDEAKDLEEPRERTESLQKELIEIQKDPRNHVLAKYLRAEMLHIMNTHGIRPRQFSIDASKVR